MKITVLHGSPRLNHSSSRIFIDFFKKQFPGHDYTVYTIGKDITRIGNNPGLFDTIIESVKESNAVLWIFPVYYTVVPAQLKRFIEMIYEKKTEDSFKDTYAAAFTTSAHYFDHTALNYIHAVSEDLGMNYVEGFSSTGYPTFDEEYKRNILTFFENFIKTAREKQPVPREYNPLTASVPFYRPGVVEKNEKKENSKICLITDAEESDENLNNMIDTFIKSTPCEVDTINLNSVKMTGCIGCLQCGNKFKCGLKDDYQSLYESRIKTADGIIYAGSIKDRFLSSRFKMFFDRSLFFNHIPYLKGKQIGVIISGNLKENANLKQSLEGIIQLNGANQIGFVTDEYSEPAVITALLNRLAAQVVSAVKKQYTKPKTFLGVGAHLLFRDLTYRIRYPFTAQFKAFKKTAFKSFPQKNKKLLLKRSFLMFMGKFNPAGFIDTYLEKSAQMVKDLLDIRKNEG